MLGSHTWEWRGVWDELQELGAKGGIPVRSQLEGLFRGGWKLLSRALVLV